MRAIPRSVTLILAAAVAVGAVSFAYSSFRLRASADLPVVPGSLATVANAQAPVRSALGSVARAALDRGNAAYREGRFDVALAEYRAAASAAPKSAAPYFGVRLAALKLGKSALADSAKVAILARVDSTTFDHEGALRTPRPRGHP